MRKQMPTPYLIYCTIPVEQYEKLIDSQIGLIKDAMIRNQNKCISILNQNKCISILQYYSYYTEEAKKMFIEELKKQGYRFIYINNDAFIEWDNTWNKEKRKE